MDDVREKAGVQVTTTAV